MTDSYIGINTPNRVSAAFQKEDFLGSDLSTITVGSTSYTNAYALSTDVDGANTENLHVVLDNVVQEPDVAYLIHENASSQPRIIQFTSAVSSTASIYVVHRGIGSFSMKPPTGSVGADQLASNLTSFTTDVFAGDGSTTAFTINSGRSVNDVLVIVNGAILIPTTDYTISGTTLTFLTAPAADAEISIRYLPI